MSSDSHYLDDFATLPALVSFFTRKAEEDDLVSIRKGGKFLRKYVTDIGNDLFR